MACKVCSAPGPKFCIGCRRKYGGQSVMRLPTSHRAAPKAAARRKSSTAAKPRGDGRKVLSREEFLKRMARGRAAAKRKRAAAGRRK